MGAAASVLSDCIPAWTEQFRPFLQWLLKVERYFKTRAPHNTTHWLMFSFVWGYLHLLKSSRKLRLLSARHPLIRPKNDSLFFSPRAVLVFSDANWTSICSEYVPKRNICSSSYRKFFLRGILPPGHCSILLACRTSHQSYEKSTEDLMETAASPRAEQLDWPTTLNSWVTYDGWQ